MTKGKHSAECLAQALNKDYIVCVFFGGGGLSLSFFLLFRATPTEHGNSQARGLIGAAAAGLRHSHSNARPEPCLRPTPQLTAISDPLIH